MKHSKWVALLFVASLSAGCKSIPKDFREFDFPSENLTGHPFGRETNMTVTYRVKGTSKSEKIGAEGRWAVASPSVKSLGAKYQAAIEAKGYAPVCVRFQDEYDERPFLPHTGQVKKVTPSYGGVFEKAGKTLAVYMFFADGSKDSEDGHILVDVDRRPEEAARKRALLQCKASATVTK